MKIGLKIWSNNLDRTKQILDFKNKNLYDYIEIYSVPETDNNIFAWKEFCTDFIVHAPHSPSGVNFGDHNKKFYNKKMFDVAKRYADGLNSNKIIIHACADLNDGTAIFEEVADQIHDLNDNRIIIENEPFCGISGQKFYFGGAFPIEKIIKDLGIDFCLDISHAICSANYFDINFEYYLSLLEKLNPIMYHCCDGISGKFTDSHMSLGSGNYDFDLIFKILKSGKYITLETGNNSGFCNFENDYSILRKIHSN